MHTQNYEWFETAKGNHTCKTGDDNFHATVFRNKNDYWQIIINTELGGQLVRNEFYDDLYDAIDRTDEILNGAPCFLLPPRY